MQYTKQNENPVVEEDASFSLRITTQKFNSRHLHWNNYFAFHFVHIFNHWHCNRKSLEMKLWKCHHLSHAVSLWIVCSTKRILKFSFCLLSCTLPPNHPLKPRGFFICLMRIPLQLLRLPFFLMLWPLVFSRVYCASAAYVGKVRHVQEMRCKA